MVFARSNKVGDNRFCAELSTGKEGECLIDGILVVLSVGLCTVSCSSDDTMGFSWISGMEVLPSTAVVLMSGEECVR